MKMCRDEFHHTSLYHKNKKCQALASTSFLILLLSRSICIHSGRVEVATALKLGCDLSRPNSEDSFLKLSLADKNSIHRLFFLGMRYSGRVNY